MIFLLSNVVIFVEPASSRGHLNLIHQERVIHSAFSGVNDKSLWARDIIIMRTACIHRDRAVIDNGA